MVSKKRNPPPAPPKPKEDSSEEEVEEEENEEDEVEEEEAKAEEEESEESKEDETESEEENPESNNEESDSPTPSPSTVKPPVTVPGKTRTSNSISKRPLESSNYTINGSRNQKRAKTIKQNYKRGNRTWSEENETVLLQGMIDFKKQNGSFPGIAVFYEFIKGKLLKGFTKPQIDDKLRKLMNKYSNPHEINMFNLSQQIWGDGIEIQIEHEKSKGGNDDVDEEIFKKFPTLINYIDEELGFLKDNIHSIGIGNAVKLEENWKELQIKDMDVLAKKLNMRSEQIKLVLDAMKKKKKQQ